MMKSAGAIVAVSLLLLPSWHARAATVEYVRAPEIECKVWLNSPPLTINQLRGKVVLIDFWEYTCINCIRTFPYLRRWNRLYGPLGLVIIGVHTPEFDFAKDPKRVSAAVKRFGFTFPIAVDSDRKIWDAYANEAWPAKYFVNPQGFIVYRHLGEGDYAELERYIQRMLKEAHPQLDFSSARFTPPLDQDQSGSVCRRPTPETYLGTDRGAQIANPGGYKSVQSARYDAPARIPPDEYALDGFWTATPQFVKSSSRSTSGTSLKLHYRAKSVYVVAGADNGKAVNLYVSEEGKPVPQASRGIDIKADSKGNTYIALASKRMYYLVNNPTFAEHTLAVAPGGPGVALYSFTFGNDCETLFDHK